MYLFLSVSVSGGVGAFALGVLRGLLVHGLSKLVLRVLQVGGVNLRQKQLPEAGGGGTHKTPHQSYIRGDGASTGATRTAVSVDIVRYVASKHVGLYTQNLETRKKTVSKANAARRTVSSRANPVEQQPKVRRVTNETSSLLTRVETTL